MKLDGKMLLCCLLESDMEQVLDKRFVSKSEMFLSYSFSSSFCEGGYSVIFAPLLNIQTSTISNDTLKRTVALFTNIAHFISKTTSHFREIIIVNNQALHERLKTQHFHNSTLSSQTDALCFVAHFR